MGLAHECFLCLPSTSSITWMQSLICALHFHMSSCIFKPNNTKLYWLDEIDIRRHLRSKCWTVVMSFGVGGSPGHQHFNLSYQHIPLARLGHPRNVHCSSLARCFLLTGLSHTLPVTQSFREIPIPVYLTHKEKEEKYTNLKISIKNKEYF